MEEKEFNLLDEKWILVRKSDYTVDELSLTDAILKSHEYIGLAGELPTQDVSILRLILAVLHTVFSRYSPNGEEASVKDPEDALERWAELWNAEKFPEKAIRKYLESVHERFWLFHPERPFYQTSAAKIGTMYSASKLNGEISESSNKIRMFSNYSGKQKNELTYPEAARWLLHINNYDDTSGKPTRDPQRKEKLPSVGAGWLGKLGLITVCGNNLFETIMYNLIMLDAKNDKIWEQERPTWELDVPRTAERTEIVVPDNLSELYTLQSRRLFMLRERNKVIGYYLLGGDFFDKIDAFTEPMTIWSVNGSEKNKIQFQPKRHDSSVQMWREFPSAFTKSDSSYTPGIVAWIEYLKKAKKISKKKLIKFAISSVQYGDKDFFVNNIFSDSITFHSDLLTDIGKHWQTTIAEEIEKCNKLAKAIAVFAKELELAAGSSDDTAGNRATVVYAREQIYYDIDIPFRKWLASINPSWEDSSEEEDVCVKKWHDCAKGIALRLSNELVKSAGTAAVIGRMVIDKDKKEKYYSAANAYKSFKGELNIIYPQEDKV